MGYARKVLSRYWLDAAVYMGLGIVVSFLSAYGPVLLQRLLDVFGQGSMPTGLIVGYGAVLGTNIVLSYLDNKPDMRLGNGIYLGYKLMALEKMRTVSYRAAQSLGTGGLIQRIEAGAQAGRGMLFDFWIQMLRFHIPGLLFSLLFIERIAPFVMLYIAIGYAVVLVVSNILLKLLYKIKERILDNEELLNHYLVRGLMELVVFRTNRRYRAEYARAKAAADEVIGAKVSMKMIHEAFFALFALLVIGIKLLVLVMSYQRGDMTVGVVVALLTLIDQAYVPIAIGNVLYVQYRLDRPAFKRLGDFLDLPDDARLDGGDAPLDPSGDIELRDAVVDYDGRRALDGLTLRIGAGKTTALVGESGSGKSTVAKLIAGLIAPDGGSISVGGQDMAHLSLDEYYRYFCYCPQEAPVFHGTLRENLTFGEAVPDERLLSALSDAQLDALVGAMPEGLDTQIGERGTLLSGGERQRLSLARALLSDARIVVLDEATSALDNELERAVMERMMRQMTGRTLVIIAHRLTTIKGADDIVAMRGGALIERGTYDELMHADGYFALLWNAAQQESECQEFLLD